MPVVSCSQAPITDQPLIAMPNRIIRDGLLDSEAILTSPIEARWLFVTICLQADDIGFFEATPFKLARKADLDVKLTSKLLLMLAEEDLIRPYTHEGKQYGFIPRFRQRLQIRKLKYPLPPECIYKDDTDAANKIKDLASNSTVEHLMGNRSPSAAQPPEAEAEAEGHELYPSDRGGTSPVAGTPSPAVDAVIAKAKMKPLAPPAPKAEPLGGYAVPDCPIKQLVAMWHEHCPMLPRIEVLTDTRQAHIRARWRGVCAADKLTPEEPVQFFAGFFKHIAKSKFLTGNVATQGDRKPFVASLDWVMKPDNFAKIIEGRYHR